MDSSAPIWEFKEMAFPRGSSREGARQVLTGMADTGRWELHRVVIDRSGKRTVWLRRKVYRVQRTA